MKKFFASSLAILILILCFSLPALATEKIDLYIDGHKIATKSYTTIGDSINTNGQYYLDVLPQNKDNLIYVPISGITKILGAEINWQKPQVTIKSTDKSLVLTIGNKEAIANGKTMKLDAPPYLFKGRTMVPLRFVSEGLGLTVNYKNNRVDIQSPALKVNGNVFDAIQAQSWMTMGSIVSESKNNICIKRIYDILSTSKVKEIPADQIPFSGIHANLDIPNFYYLAIEYSFKSGDKTVEQYQIYSQLSFGMDTNTYAIKDTINSRWYTFTKAKYYNIVDLHTLGNWKTISNTVV